MKELQPTKDLKRYKNKPAKLAALNKVLNYKSGAMACSASVVTTAVNDIVLHLFRFFCFFFFDFLVFFVFVS